MQDKSLEGAYSKNNPDKFQTYVMGQKQLIKNQLCGVIPAKKDTFLIYYLFLLNAHVFSKTVISTSGIFVDHYNLGRNRFEWQTLQTCIMFSS